MSDWSEHQIAGALARQVFLRKCLVVMPNCYSTGYECDLLVVTQNLRVIDVEIKISRSDLRADAKKEKWWDRPNWMHRYKETESLGLPREYPPKVWKHYYAMPREVWKPELVEVIATVSGVLLLDRAPSGLVLAHVARRAKPNRHAATLSMVAVIDIARKASLRMWDAFDTATGAKANAALLYAEEPV